MSSDVKLYTYCKVVYILLCICILYSSLSLCNRLTAVTVCQWFTSSGLSRNKALDRHCRFCHLVTGEPPHPHHYIHRTSKYAESTLIIKEISPRARKDVDISPPHPHPHTHHPCASHLIPSLFFLDIINSEVTSQ